jgi:hypothetical protein
MLSIRTIPYGVSVGFPCCLIKATFRPNPRGTPGSRLRLRRKKPKRRVPRPMEARERARAALKATPEPRSLRVAKLAKVSRSKSTMAFGLLPGKMARGCGSTVPRSHLSWPRLRPASGSMSISKATARPSSPMPARWASKVSCQSRKGLGIPFRPLAGLAQNEEPGGSGGEAGGRGGLGAMMGKNMIA